MPNIKGVKHKVDTKGTDLTKLPPSPVKARAVHQGLPYGQVKIRPKVDTWRYFDTMVNIHSPLLKFKPTCIGKLSNCRYT